MDEHVFCWEDPLAQNCVCNAPELKSMLETSACTLSTFGLKCICFIELKILLPDWLRSGCSWWKVHVLLPADDGGTQAHFDCGHMICRCKSWDQDLLPGNLLTSALLTKGWGWNEFSSDRQKCHQIPEISKPKLFPAPSHESRASPLPLCAAAKTSCFLSLTASPVQLCIFNE